MLHGIPLKRISHNEECCRRILRALENYEPHTAEELKEALDALSFAKQIHQKAMLAFRGVRTHPSTVVLADTFTVVGVQVYFFLTMIMVSLLLSACAAL